MINNKELIKQLLHFPKEGDFYMLYILKRKKDQPEGEKQNHQSVRTIKTYAIDSFEYLEKRWDEITHLCEYFKARAYIHVQRQNHHDIGLNMMVELANRMREGVYKFNNLFDSVVGQIKVYEKLWIVDIDTKDRLSVHHTASIINSVQPAGDKIVAEIPTKNGCHLITLPFNVSEFTKHPDQRLTIDIQKKNPTLLYLPDSLN